MSETHTPIKEARIFQKVSAGSSDGKTLPFAVMLGAAHQDLTSGEASVGNG